MREALVGLLIGGVGAGALIMLLAPTHKPIKCPACSREQPRIRHRTNIQQMMWGGYTCPGCGAEMDARGRLKSK